MIFNQRVIQPSELFSKQANLNKTDYEKLMHSAANNYEEHWASLARENIQWKKPFSTPMKWNPPFVEWFADGELNISEQCLDKHLKGSFAEKTALIWEGEPCEDGTPTERTTLTYRQLHAQVCAFAEGLNKAGITRGDRVALYLPMIPESVVAMLACARIGATHTVVFGGFSAESLRDRILDAKAKCVITANGGFRRGKILPLKIAVDKAVAESACVEKVIVVDRLGETSSSAYSKSQTAFEKLRCIKAEIFGSMMFRFKVPCNLPNRFRQSILYLFYIQVAQLENQRVLCMELQAMLCGQTSHANGFLILNRTTFTGALPTSVG